MAPRRQSSRISDAALQQSKGIWKAIWAKQSFLCVGLDPDPAKIPYVFGEGVQAMESFCHAIVQATLPYAIAFKPNLAFFEQYGSEGWAALERVIDGIPADVLVIADAKRGDIGNTAGRYADGLFNGLGADAATVAPYMGRDSVEPFTAFENKWTILLALTSNPGADDFEFHGEVPLFHQVLKSSQSFEGAERLMYVVGATRPERLKEVRELVPDSFLLVPGVGAQGGRVEEVAKYGFNDQCGLLINSSRGILYAASQSSNEEEVLAASTSAAASVAAEMARMLQDRFPNGPE